MNKLFGSIREIITAIGGLLVVTNVIDQSSADQVLGLILACVGIIGGVYANAGAETITSLLRKFISLIPAVLVHFGMITPELASQLAAMAFPLASIAWSVYEKSQNTTTPPYGLMITALLGASIFMNVSCTSTQLKEFRDSRTGQLVIKRGGSLLVAEQVKDRPELAPMLLILADAQEGINVDLEQFDDQLLALGIEIIGSLSYEYSDDVTPTLIATALRDGVRMGLGSSK